MIAIICALPDEFPNVPRMFNGNVFWSGMGKINAALTTANVIRQYDPDIIIHLGTCGSHNKKHKGLIQCGNFVDRDSGGIIEGDPDLSWISTGDSFVTNLDETAGLVDMEAYAIAYTCKRYPTKFYCYKYVTDYIGQDNFKNWRDNIDKGRDSFIEVLYDHFKNPV